MRPLFAALSMAMATSTAVATVPLAPVPDLDLARYAGTWHEIARLPMWFQRKCERGVTAHYEPRPDGTVAVHNACVTAEGKTLDQATFESLKKQATAMGYDLAPLIVSGNVE